MFEDKTFEYILSDMLGYVSEKNPDLDTKEGSIIYTALAPVAIELETLYHNADMIVDETFLETASKEYLIKHGDQTGVEINEATNGHFKGKFDVDVEIGSRFNLDEFNYSVINKLSNPSGDNDYYIFELVCETAGSAPNARVGDLTPITYVANLNYAKLVSVIAYGEDEEEIESYRYRIQTHIKNPPINGNVAQYNEWLDNYDGIGKYKTIPCWNGKNTVKLIVLNTENKKASVELIEEVQNYFDPTETTEKGVKLQVDDNINADNYPQGRGMGNGQAPIGAIITVDTVTEVPVKVSCKLVLKEGYETPVGVKEAIENYFDNIALNKTIIGYMPISAEIYNAESVEDVKSLSIVVNDITMDTEVSPFVDSVTIGSNEIAVLDTDNFVWGV